MPRASSNASFAARAKSLFSMIVGTHRLPLTGKVAALFTDMGSTERVTHKQS